MTSAVTSTAIVVYNPEVHPLLQVRERLEKMQRLFRNNTEIYCLLEERVLSNLYKKSLQVQIADLKLSSIPLSSKLITGRAISPIIDPISTNPFNGTREELLLKIENTVHKTLDGLDFNGLWPYLQVIDEIMQGKSFDEINIDSSHEPEGATCMGMSHHLLKNLKEEHHVEGMLAVLRQSPEDPFAHGAVIVQCSDGYVLIENKSNPSMRIFSIAYQSTLRQGDWMLTASGPGSLVPIRVQCKKTEKVPKMSFEYCVRVANGNDLVMKFYMAIKTTSYIPIVVFNCNGSTNKYMKIYPKQTKIEFLHHDKQISDVIPFDAVFTDDFRAKLMGFMKPNLIYTTFHSSAELIHRQILRFVSGANIVRNLFTEVNFYSRSNIKKAFERSTL